jgi:hypothetical protein
MTLKNKFKRAIGGVALALASLPNVRAADSHQPHGKAEVFVRRDKATTDFKVFGNLFNRINYFARNVNTLDYKTEKISPFTFVDLSYNLGKGFRAVYETQFIDLRDSTLIQPRFGIEYFKPLKNNLALYAINSINVPTERDPIVNGELVATLRYTPSLRKDGKLKLVLQGETVTNYGQNGLNFASQKFRAGIGNKIWEGGIGLNLDETIKSSTQTIGVFFGLNF